MRRANIDQRPTITRPAYTSAAPTSNNGPERVRSEPTTKKEENHARESLKNNSGIPEFRLDFRSAECKIYIDEESNEPPAVVGERETPSSRP
jgi:hypothetical protein